MQRRHKIWHTFFFGEPYAPQSIKHCESPFASFENSLVSSAIPANSRPSFRTGINSQFCIQLALTNHIVDILENAHKFALNFAFNTSGSLQILNGLPIKLKQLMPMQDSFVSEVRGFISLLLHFTFALSSTVGQLIPKILWETSIWNLFVILSRQSMNLLT